MKEPMYMLLNLAVGGNGSWPGAPDNATAFPADLKIDYVRAEQTSNTIGWTDPMPTQPGPLVLPAIQEAARPGTAYAYVFVEHFGIEDTGTPIGGVGVALLNSSGKVIATGTTSQTGVYTFGGLAAGTYSIQYITPGSLYVRPGNFADAKSGITGSFTLSDGQGYGVPFQLVSSSAELAGDVQLGTQGIANVTVELLDAQKSVVKATTTDGSGHFSFWTPAGSYYVRYIPSPGTTLLSGSLADPTSGLTPVIVLSDQHDFLLVPEQFAASSATNSPVPATISATPSSAMPVANIGADTSAEMAEIGVAGSFNDQATAVTQVVPNAPVTPVSVAPILVSSPMPISIDQSPQLNDPTIISAELSSTMSIANNNQTTTVAQLMLNAPDTPVLAVPISVSLTTPLAVTQETEPVSPTTTSALSLTSMSFADKQITAVVSTPNPTPVSTTYASLSTLTPTSIIQTIDSDIPETVSAIPSLTIPVTNNDQVTAAIQIVPTAPATPVSVTSAPVSAPTPTSTTPTTDPVADPLPDSPQPTYRFFDEINGTQFLTSSQSERDALLSNRSNFTYEGYGINSVTMDSSDRNVAPVFRFFSTSNGTHFFTTNVDERNTILATRPDLVQEQANFAEHLTPQAGDAAVYRFFDSHSGDHFFTQSAAEHASIISSRPDMIDEGIAFYAPSQV